MLTSKGPEEESFASALAEADTADPCARVANLERELAASRTREETAKTALLNVHEELERAHSRIAQQQEKLRALVVQAQKQRASAANSAPSLRDVAVASADHPYRKIAAHASLSAPTPPQLLPIGNTRGLARVRKLWQRVPAWTKGTILPPDAAFLDAVLDRVRPDQVHEVGVASGTSSALILSTMATQEKTMPVWLQSYDLVPKCYFDPAHHVGDATREMVPTLLPYWKLRTGATALDVLRDQPASERPLYFIDANHSHPWPVLDLIALLPGLRPGDYVVLHDINLPTMNQGQFPDYGAQFLFEDWLGPRLTSDVELPNIGAILVPDDWRLVVSSLVKSLARPWMFSNPAEIDHLHRCEQRFADFVAKHSLNP